MDMEKIYQGMPTVKWRTGMYPYPKELLEESEKALHTFARDLEKLGNGAPQQSIMECVEAVVVTFNEIDEKYSFIETIEREELCEYIYIVAKMAGLDVDGNDITEEWRDW